MLSSVANLVQAWMGRLKLSPSLRRVGRRPANRRPSRPALEGGSKDDDEDDEKHKTGRAALLQLVNAAVALTVVDGP